MVALRNGYRIFLKHVCTFVIGRYINTICSGGDLGSCKAALSIAGEEGGGDVPNIKNTPRI